MQKITLDLVPGKKMPSLHASQFDDGRAYHIDLTENRVPYTLDGTETISVIIRKCDNTLVSMDIANTFADKSYIEFEVVEQMTACSGFNYGEIILEKNGDRLGSLNFYLQVEAAPDENGITSKSEVLNLNRQITEEVDRILPDMVEAYYPQIDERVDDEVSEAMGNYYTKTATDEMMSGKVGKVKASGFNLFNGEFSDTNGYYNGTGITIASNYKMTKPIWLEAGTYYYNLITLSYGGVAPYFARTNQTGTTLTRMTATATGDTLTVDNKTYDIYGFTITEADYYLFNANTGATATASSAYFMVSTGVPTRYVPYQEVNKVERGVLLNDDMVEQIHQMQEVDPLYQKSISADGDSICAGAGYTGGYAKIIADSNDMIYQNLAVGGATIVAETYTSGGVARHWVSRSMQNISTSADYILINGGVNDASLNVTLGSISSGYTATLDDTTFYGALETIFKTLTTKYVGKKYGFIIPHRMTSGMYPNGSYSNAIYECGEKWGVPILDLSKSVPPFNNFRNTDEYDTIRNAYTKDGDGWHPTKKCYDQYYVPQIEAFLKSL